ncbi:MAG: hypothetical protein IJ438_09475 [Clostridia bacterium]|nr:hypothetical protein [Clostridia bacterium]
MMNNEFIHWCDARIAHCQAQQQRLAADQRGDEASFMQIRANVYGIFRTTCTALGGDMVKLADQLTTIPAAWAKSLEIAEAHGDEKKAHIERIKLETVQDICHYLSNLEAN